MIGQFRRSLVFVLAALSLMLVLAATPAFAISRNTVIARSQVWMDAQVPYSQHAWVGGYRTDCSGYVSMCWKTGLSWSTRSFHSVSSTITVEQLLPGDAMHKVGHIRLFYAWYDDSHTRYICYEQTGPTLKSSIRTIAEDLAAGYHPCRYRSIVNSAPGRNLLRNPTFDVWVRSWGSALETPVWWSVTGASEATLTLRDKTASRTGRNSIEVLNPSVSPTAYTSISQIVTITPEATLAVTAWARTASDPGAIRVSVDYLDGGGVAVACLRTYGSSFDITPDEFGQVAAILAPPAGAMQARVTVRLAGGQTPEGTQTVDGTSVLLDDLALLRPYSSVSIARSVASTTIGHKATLSGTLVATPASAIPTAAVGVPYQVYVKKPGSAVWRPWHTHLTTAAASGGAWKCAYGFPRGSKRGTYRFKVEVPPFGDFLGSTSSTITVTLR